MRTLDYLLTLLLCCTHTVDCYDQSSTTAGIGSGSGVGVENTWQGNRSHMSITGPAGYARTTRLVRGATVYCAHAHGKHPPTPLSTIIKNGVLKDLGKSFWVPSKQELDLILGILKWLVQHDWTVGGIWSNLTIIIIIAACLQQNTTCT